MSTQSGWYPLGNGNIGYWDANQQAWIAEQPDPNAASHQQNQAPQQHNQGYSQQPHQQQANQHQQAQQQGYYNQAQQHQGYSQQPQQNQAQQYPNQQGQRQQQSLQDQLFSGQGNPQQGQNGNQSGNPSGPRGTGSSGPSEVKEEKSKKPMVIFAIIIVLIIAFFSWKYIDKKNKAEEYDSNNAEVTQSADVSTLEGDSQSGEQSGGMFEALEPLDSDGMPVSSDYTYPDWAYHPPLNGTPLATFSQDGIDVVVQLMGTSFDGQSVFQAIITNSTDAAIKVSPTTVSFTAVPEGGEDTNWADVPEDLVTTIGISKDAWFEGDQELPTGSSFSIPAWSNASADDVVTLDIKVNEVSFFDYVWLTE